MKVQLLQLRYVEYISGFQIELENTEIFSKSLNLWSALNP